MKKNPYLNPAIASTLQTCGEAASELRRQWQLDSELMSLLSDLCELTRGDIDARQFTDRNHGCDPNGHYASIINNKIDDTKSNWDQGHLKDNNLLAEIIVSALHCVELDGGGKLSWYKSLVLHAHNYIATTIVEDSHKRKYWHQEITLAARNMPIELPRKATERIHTALGNALIRQVLSELIADPIAFVKRGRIIKSQKSGDDYCFTLSGHRSTPIELTFDNVDSSPCDAMAIIVECDDGETCYSDAADIARVTGCKVDTLRISLSQLIESYWVDKVQRG